MATQKLQPVHPRDRDPEYGDVDIILIAGVCMPPTPEWSILSEQWTSDLESTESRTNIFSYSYEITLDEDFSIQALLDEGHNLLTALSQHQQYLNTVRPLLFVGHSLGCLVVKQALCVANAQKYSYSQVLNSVLGIIFLGNLHLPSDPAKLSERYGLILRSIPSKVSKQAFDRIAQDSCLLADVSRLFDDIELQVEILSLYESKETRVRVGLRDGKGLFSPYKSYILTCPKTSITSAIREQHFALSGIHAELPSLQQPDGKPHRKVQEWLHFVLSNDYRKIFERRLNPENKSSPTISLTSMSSYDAARIALQDYVYKPPTVHAQSLGSLDVTADSSLNQNWQIIPILNSFTVPRRSAKIPCFMMDTPVRNKAFFGRDSILRQLDEHFFPEKFSMSPLVENTFQKHVVLCGIAGIGKTSIAIEYVFSRKEKFEAIFWIRADEPSKLEQDFCRIAIELGLQDANEPFNPVVCRELTKGWLENPIKVVNQMNDIIGQAEARWLIIFDNADSPDLLQDYWPLSSNGSILVTSRDPLSRNSPSIASKHIDVSPFDEEEAAELLQRLSGVDKDVDVSVQIAAKLGGLPLAISQMAAVIRYQYLSFPEFYEWYEVDSEKRELLALDATAPRPEARGNIASIWAIEQLKPQARCLLEVCAMLDPDRIQEQIFTQDLSGVGHLEHFPKTPSAYLAARADLLKRSLIVRNSEKKEFGVHRVLQSSVLSKMASQRMFQVFSFTVDLLLTAWGSTPLVQRHAISLARSRDGLFPHVLILMRFFGKNYKEDNHKNAILQLAKLMNEAGWYQHERGDYNDIKPFFHLGLEICSRTPGSESSQLRADIHYGLGAVANDTNDKYSCLYHNDQLLKLRLEAHSSTGKIDIRLGIAHNQYGIALAMDQQFEKAILAFKTSIEVYRELEGYWPSMDTNPRMNLGFSYWVTGALDQAEQVLRDLLKDRETKFGVNDRESYRTGRVYHGLGNVCYDRGLFEESENWHQRALSHYQATIGNMHHKTADICHRVAQHCLRRGELEHARTLIDQALKIYGLEESAFLPQLARTTFLKANLAMHLGEALEASQHFKKAKDMRLRISHATYKPDASLREVDFNELVTYFSR